MTIHASKGQQADYVIVLGLQQGKEGFPAPQRESIMEQGCCRSPKTSRCRGAPAGVCCPDARAATGLVAVR